MTATDKQIEELFNAGCHLGHKVNRIHPKSKKYIYRIENGASIIDLTQTVVKLNYAKEIIAKLAKEKKTILVVASKKIASRIIQKMCLEYNLAFVTIKWPAGLLTNFEMIMRNVKKMLKMKEARDNGEWNKYVKHEQTQMAKELYKLEKFYGGLRSLLKLPDALLIFDSKKEANAVKEAKEMNIPIIAVTDTNSNPDLVNYPIPANDDLLSSVEYLANQLIHAYKVDKKEGNKEELTK